MPRCGYNRMATLMVKGVLKDIKTNCLDYHQNNNNNNIDGEEPAARHATIAVISRRRITDHLDVLTTARSHSLLVLVRGRALYGVEVDALRSLDANSAFFLAQHWDVDGEAKVTFQLVHTFQRDRNLVTMLVSFHPAPPLAASLDYDLQGAKLYSSVVDYWPYVTVERCDGEARNCQLSGPYADLWRLLEHKYNFTTQVEGR